MIFKVTTPYLRPRLALGKEFGAQGAIRRLDLSRHGAFIVQSMHFTVLLYMDAFERIIWDGREDTHTGLQRVICFVFTSCLYLLLNTKLLAYHFSAGPTVPIRSGLMSSTESLSNL